MHLVSATTDYSIPSRFFVHGYDYDDCEFRERPQESDLQVYKDLMSAFRAFVELNDNIPINGKHQAVALLDDSNFEMIRKHIKNFFFTYMDVYCHRKKGPNPDCILRVPFRDVEGSTPEEIFQADVSDILDFQTKCWEGNLDRKFTEVGISRRLDLLKDIQAHALELDMEELESAVTAITGTCVHVYYLARSLAIGIHCRGAAATDYKQHFSYAEVRDTPEEWFKMLPAEPSPDQSQPEVVFWTMPFMELLKCLPDKVKIVCERWINLVQLTMHGLLEMQTHLVSKSGDLSWSLSVGDNCGPVYITRCSIVTKLQEVIQTAKKELSMCHLDESVIGTHYKIVEFKYVRSRPLGYECDDTEYQDVCQANHGMFSSPAGISQDCHELKFESDRFLIRLQVKNPDSQFMNEVIEGLVPKSFVM